MFTFGLEGKVNWKSLGQELKRRGIDEIRVTGGMGSFWHVFALNGQEFSVVDDGFNDWVTAKDKAVLEQVRTEFFTSYRPEEIQDKP